MAQRLTVAWEQKALTQQEREPWQQRSGNQSAQQRTLYVNKFKYSKTLNYYRQGQQIDTSTGMGKIDTFQDHQQCRTLDLVTTCVQGPSLSSKHSKMSQADIRYWQAPCIQRPPLY